MGTRVSTNMLVTCHVSLMSEKSKNKLSFYQINKYTDQKIIAFNPKEKGQHIRN